MTKKSRTILFVICVLLFIITAPAITFYYLGYRLDFDSKKIVSTGAFYFKIWPKNAQIYLNSKLKKKTDFLFGAAYLDNLLPKKYEVEIKKEGFLPWKKSLGIKERQVTELKNIFLVPEHPAFNILARNIENFWFSPDEKKVIFQKINENGWELTMTTLENNLEIHLLDEKDIRKENGVVVSLLNLRFSPNSSQILIETENLQRKEYFFASINQIPLDLISLNFVKEKVENISFDPRSSEQILFKNENKLFEVNLTEKTKNLLLDNLTTYETSDGNIYFLSKSGFLFRSDLLGRIQEKLSSEPILLNDEASYQIYIKGKEIFLLENDALYLFDKEIGKFEKIFGGVKNFEVSPDSKKIFIATTHEIWVFFLEKIYEQPPKEKGENVFLTRFSEKINEVFWYTDHYLIFDVSSKIRTSSTSSENLDFSFGSKIKIAEIDDRDRINIVNLVEFQAPKIFFNTRDRKLYVLEEGKFFSSEKLLP